MFPAARSAIILSLCVATSFGQSGVPDTFLRLRDTPDTYAGAANKYVRVNAAANKLEFVSGGGGGGAVVFTDLADVPSSYTGQSLKSVRVNTGETGLEFFTSTGVPTSRTLTIGGTAQDLSADRSWLGNVTNDAQTKAAIVPNTAPLAGQILVGNAGNTAYAKQTVSGSGATISLSDAGVITISAIANASLANTAVANLSGTNSGDQTSIVGITGTKAQFDTAVTDGNILYVGDVTQYTDELAQDAVGAMVDSSLTYVDATPLLQRAALTGDITAPAGSNATTLATVNANVGSFTNANITVNGKGLITAAANGTGGASGADPTGTVGLSTVNGSAGTFLRSDGAPPLSQAITPTWTGVHTWKLEDATTSDVSNVLIVGHNSTGAPASGFGTTILATAETNTTPDTIVGGISWQWSTVTHGSRASYVTVQPAGTGGLTTGLRVYQSGGATLSLNGTDPGLGVFNAPVGYQVANVASSGKVLQGNGTNFIPSTPTWPTSAGTSGNVVMSNGTNFTSAADTGGWTELKVAGSDFTTSSTSLVDITGLVSSTLSTATLYRFEADLYVNSTSTAGLAVGVQQSGTGTGQIGVWSGNATSATATGIVIASNALNQAGAPCVLVNGDGMVKMSGYIKTGSSGTPTISCKILKTTSGTAKVYINSVFRYRTA